MGDGDTRLSRRRLLRGALVGGSGLLAAYVVGCGDGDGDGSQGSASSSATAEETDVATPIPEATAADILRWGELDPSGERPSARHDHSLVTDGRSLFLFGGRSGDKELGDLWSFDTEAGTWNELSSAGGPPARFGHNAVFDQARGRMLVFGGQAGGAFFNDLWGFLPADGKWVNITELNPVLPAKRYGAAGALDPAGRFLVTHGFTDAGRFNDTWSFALEGGAWTEISPIPPRPVERCLMRGVWDTVANRFLMFGGQTTDRPFLSDLWALDANGWTEITTEPRPSPRKFYAIVHTGSLNMLFGGNTEGGPKNDLWWLLPSGLWAEIPVDGEAPSPRFGHDAVWLADSGRMIVFGGQDDSGELDDLWELSPPA